MMGGRTLSLPAVSINARRSVASSEDLARGVPGGNIWELVNPGQAIARDARSTSNPLEGALTEEQLSDARRGFERLLRGKGFSREFIESHAADLMSRAVTEMAAKIKRGDTIHKPAGLLVTIAYRRTQNFLESKERGPAFVGLEAVAELPAEEDGTPEAATLDKDRVAKVHAAVKRLTVEERKLVALEFFQRMNLSQAACELGWDESKARRRHKAAMNHLKELLGVESSDDIAFDIGFLCWLSVAFGQQEGFSLGREIETLWQRAEDLVLVGADKAEHLAHKANARLGGDPSAASAVTGMGRAAKACGVAALCVATAGAGVAVVSGGGTRPVPETHKEAGSFPEATGPAAQIEKNAAAWQGISASAGAAPTRVEHRAKREQVERTPSDGSDAPAVADVAEPGYSQPPPAEVVQTLEEGSRPSGGPLESHPSTGPEGSAVASNQQSGGASPAQESLEAGRP